MATAWTRMTTPKKQRGRRCLFVSASESMALSANPNSGRKRVRKVRDSKQSRPGAHRVVLRKKA